MKKLVFLILGLAAAGTVSAAHPLIGGPNNYLMTDCDLLANDVKLILTAGVVGGVQCNTTDNFVAVSLCHTSGSTQSRSAVVTTNPDGSVKCQIDDTHTCVETVTGSSFPTASTLEGTVASSFPGNTCDATNVGTVADAVVRP